MRLYNGQIVKVDNKAYIIVPAGKKYVLKKVDFS